MFGVKAEVPIQFWAGSSSYPNHHWQSIFCGTKISEVEPKLNVNACFIVSNNIGAVDMIVMDPNDWKKENHNRDLYWKYYFI